MPKHRLDALDRGAAAEHVERAGVPHAVGSDLFCKG